MITMIFFIFCSHSNSIREATAKKAKLHYFMFIFFFNEISRLEIYQKFSQFILPVRGHNLNKSEMAQFLQFYGSFKKDILFLKSVT